MPPIHVCSLLAQKIRRHVLEMTALGKSSHIGSVFSIADILGVLYGGIMQFDPQNPRWAGRDRFILSKGHAGAGVYAALAESGFFSVSVLKTHGQNGSSLSGHVSHYNVPGVELSTGSLGHGLSVGAGMALAAKKRGEAHRVFVVMSDGECDEGSNWEAILFAGFQQLSGLVVIVDYNKLQSLTTVSETLALEPFADKWRAFGWEVREADGHDHADLYEKISLMGTRKPICILAHTLKGKGVSFMEGQVVWHYRPPSGEDLIQARKELS